MPPSDQHDAQLTELLEGLFAARRRGERVDVDHAAQEHPELSAELRELWAAAELADWVGSASWNGADQASPAAASPPQALPRTFGGYELLEELGRGGMGVVYRARQPQLDRTVALKMVLRGPLATAEDLSRLRSEAAAAARLDHPAIVPVYEVGECEGQPYFSMQLIEGHTLSARLADGPLPPRQAAELLLEVARAIHVAHQSGLLHRDIKPSNILIDAAGRPHVTDFGLAKRVAGLSGNGNGGTATTGMPPRWPKA